MKLIYFIRGIGQHSPNLREVCVFPPLHFSRVNIYFTPATRNKFNNIIMKEYNDLMKDIPKEDMSARREKLKHVYEWSKSSSVIPSNKSAKSISTKLENAKVQFSGLVCNSQMVYSTIYFFTGWSLVQPGSDRDCQCSYVCWGGPSRPTTFQNFWQVWYCQKVYQWSQYWCLCSHGQVHIYFQVCVHIHPL